MSRAGSAGAGATGGTLLVVVANNLPADSPLRLWLYGFAPVVAVTLAWLAAWVRDLIGYRLDRWQLAALVREAEAVVARADTDPACTPADREASRRDLDTIRRMAADRRLEQARRIRDRGRGG